mmetsp:Transcript_1999/g.5992  ORF Transcript_1999/g.5992 Transcript_1999/m.5992 type:complete len:404 (-) Transcript_1999:181-1392(-)|eukprot:CAMPEP_0118881426 /NCGR_PEP_ID=MMETSP1163-20130328/20913_1 /TAXON_ID=124430 /ORGANISM="Phaeomonas parva, Strain CCMP2877" /LENGTH=403 /DNA_ID=CAMNT_0006818209 /DNA_START=77 /DNA_END=1288 /DNA_ORIENTATION=+
MELRRRCVEQLALRATRGSLRRLELPYAEDAARRLADFSSNDYLGLARSPALLAAIEEAHAGVVARRRALGAPILGSSGSRLLAGNCEYAEEIEEAMAAYFRRPAALAFNSGYDLNLSLMSSLCTGPDLVVLDELVHNSVQMGVRMSRTPRTNVVTFRHNDAGDLERVLREGVEGSQPQRQIFIAIESLYSMDGDIAPLQRILDLAEAYGAAVIVDEAHASCVYGPRGEGIAVADGVQDHPALLCTVHTFGKAFGVHGAVGAMQEWLKDYLVNYGRPFIYSTAPSLHTLTSMGEAVRFVQTEEGDGLRAQVMDRVREFREGLEARGLGSELRDSPSPIQALNTPGNENSLRVASFLRESGFDVRAIRAPTVPDNEERLRVILHSHNSAEEVGDLVDCIATVVG